MKILRFNITGFFAILFPIKLLIKLTGIRIIYPFYHIVNDNPPQHIKHLYSVRTVKEFRKDLDFLTKNFQSTKEVFVESDNKTNYFNLSFDDGLNESYSVIAPILKDYNIKATFFINSGFVDNKGLFFKYKASILISNILQNDITEKQKSAINLLILSKKILTVEQIKKFIFNIDFSQKQKLDKISDILKINFKDYLQESTPYLTNLQIKELLKEGHQIGAHSIDHPLYSDLNEAEQIRQTSVGNKYIQDQFDVKTKLFAFPFTDDQVKTSFFNTVFNNQILDYSFGTAGIKEDSVKNNIQRIPIEKSSISAERYIKTEYLLYFLKKMVKKHIIKRK